MQSQKAGICTVTVPEGRGPSSILLLDIIKSGFLGQKDVSGATNRVVVVDHQGLPMTSFSQSDLLKYLRDRKDVVVGASRAANETLENLGLCSRKVLSIDSRHSALYALHRMKKFKVYSAAVVDVSSGGKLVQQLTTNHLRGMRNSPLGQLLRPVVESTASGERPREPCVVKKTDTLWHTIEQLVMTRHLRAIVVDIHNRPVAQVGALSLVACLMRPPKIPKKADPPRDK
eukprot:Hpha_TRINITY_DN13156_c0_g1::TRINITY_DN13156_c0_g1_i1::g.113434::m.113434